MRGWERVTPTDLARLGAHAPKKAARESRQKFHAEPCLVLADGTLFTATDIRAAEDATHHPLAGTGTLKERAARYGIHGQWFASKKEGARYLELKALERIGAVTQLRCQVPYDLTVVSKIDGREHTVGTWTADFTYHRDGTLIVEDTKSTATKTTAYQIRKKIVQAIYGIEILET